ncbi:unnamed protein product, partial [Meganyctiphanes norvegica]
MPIPPRVTLYLSILPLKCRMVGEQSSYVSLAQCRRSGDQPRSRRELLISKMLNNGSNLTQKRLVYLGLSTLSDFTTIYDAWYIQITPSQNIQLNTTGRSSGDIKNIRHQKHDLYAPGLLLPTIFSGFNSAKFVKPAFKSFLNSKIQGPKIYFAITFKFLVRFEQNLEERSLQVEVGCTGPKKFQREQLITNLLPSNSTSKKFRNKRGRMGIISYPESTMNVHIKLKDLFKSIEKFETMKYGEMKEIAPFRYIPVHKAVCTVHKGIMTVGEMEISASFWLIKLFTTLNTSLQTLTLPLQAIMETVTYHILLQLNSCSCNYQTEKLVWFSLVHIVIMSVGRTTPGGRWLFTIAGVQGSIPDGPSPPSCKWVPAPALELLQLRITFTEPRHMVPEICDHLDDWRKVFESNSPEREDIPESPDKPLTRLQRLCVLRSLRPDKVVAGVMDFVSDLLGKQYIEDPPFDLQRTFADSHCTIPLIFLLTPGADPTQLLLKFADDQGMGGDRLQTVSLGQGQGPVAKRLIEEGVRIGSWVLLQNCHLAKSFMSTLEKVCEELNPETTHPDFRLWLTSYPSASFPVSVLQNGIKMVTEPPKGLKSNLRRLYLADPISEPDFLTGPGADVKFRRLIFALCFFHSVVQERRLFGPLGWNIPYSFSDTDLRISAQQLRNLLNAYEEIPWEALQYLTAECNYGGKVTDERDRRTLSTILRTFYDPEVIDNSNHSFDEDGVYRSPSDGDIEHYLNHISELPRDTPPHIFGMNSNASINKDQAETTKLFAAVLLTQSLGSGGSGEGEGDTVARTCEEILKKIPEPFRVDDALAKFPTIRENSLNTVMVQEMCRYNNLINTINSTLSSVLKAMAG